MKDRKDRTRVLILGAKSAGKTELLRRISGNFQIMAPTIGCRMESLDTGNVIFTCLDMAVSEKLQPVWEQMYREVDSILFVVDSSDKAQLKQVRRYLDHILAQRSLEGCQVVVAANKQDLPGARSARKVADRLGLHQLRGRDWKVVEICATSGLGVEDLMENFVLDETRPCHKELEFDFHPRMQMTSLKDSKKSQSLPNTPRLQKAYNVAKALPRGFAFTGYMPTFAA